VVAGATLVRALLALVVLVTAGILAVVKPPRLGLDLRGGTQIVLEAQDTKTVSVNRDVTDRTLEVLRRRVDALGVTEPTLARSGERRIVVELPGVTDAQEAQRVIGRTAQLTFHPVVGAGEPPAASEPETRSLDGAQWLPDEDGQPLGLGPGALTGDHVKGADAIIDPQFGAAWQVNVDFRGAGSDRWAKLTGEAACHPSGDPQRRIAIVLDDKVISSPQVVTDVRCGTGIPGGSTTITGSFTAKEAKDLALLIRAGALPVPVEVVEQRTVGPTLGEAAIDASSRAGLIGAALTMLFVIAVYRLAGTIAALALAGYALISYAALLAFGATLTLPGIAGFVLAIGMAVDANVLVFERTREEYAGAAKGRLRRAVASGFKGAWSAIIDSNVTTLLAAGLLFYLAAGPVRGFGVTLSIGVLASMFTTLVVTRALLEFAAGRKRVRARPRVTGLADIGAVRRWLVARRPDLMRHRRRWLALSAVAVLVSLAGIGVRGLDLGLEFTGGRTVEYATARTVDVDDARSAVAGAGLPRAVVQTTDNGIAVRAAGMSDAVKADVRAALAQLGGDADAVRDEFIGPSLSGELRGKALIALGVALVAQLLYLAVRFRWRFSAAAVLAMAHDVVILLGLFAWLGKPIDGVFLAALLTVIGYSVNDSVVVFDRIRELLRSRRKEPLATVANDACLQTVPRTVNTGMGALFILAALTLLGGDSLTDFALALLVGILLGTWSSVFTATPLAIAFGRSRRSKRKPQGGSSAAGSAGQPIRRAPSTALYRVSRSRGTARS
jgi:SecD/SecF fusion protein